MKMSTGVEWAVHCCVVMSRSTAPVPAARLAAYHGVSGSSLAKHLQALAGAGLVRSVEGRDGGYTLTRDAGAITLRDIVEALDGRQPIFRCTEIRQQGPHPTTGEACRRPCGVARAMHDAELTYREALGLTSVADLAAGVESDSGAGALDVAADWLRNG